MQNDRIIADDLIVLGNAVPDVISDERITVCTAAYCKDLGLVRIYPVPPVSPMKRWNIVRIPLERNPKDTRSESWKIQGSKSEWDQISRKIELKGTIEETKRLPLLEELYSKFGVDCVEQLNDKLVSFGLIKPKIISYQLETREDFEKSTQLSLDSREPFLTIKNYALRPVISYRCQNCKTKGPHSQQVLEWGIYEWLRRHPNEPKKVWENLRMKESGYYRSFLVGNLALFRTSFCIISMFRKKLQGQTPTAQVALGSQ